MKSFAAIWKFAFDKSATPEPPAPYEIALTFATALLSSGRFADDMTAAMDTAWTLVIPFYQGQLAYQKNVATLFDLTRHASSPEPQMTRQEARAYVAGEADGGAPMASMTIDIAAIQAKQVRIAETTQAVIRAEAVLEEARAGNDMEAIAKAQEAFDLAAKEQSEAYL